MNNSKKLRALMARAFVGANVLLLLLCCFSVYQSHENYEERAASQTQNIAFALDQNISRSIAKIDLALDSVVDEIQRQLANSRIDEQSINTFLNRMSERIPEVELMRVADADGIVSFGDTETGSSSVEVEERDYFRYLSQHREKKLFITNELMGKISHHFVILFAKRYDLPNGRFGGVAYATIPADHFRDLVSGFDIGEHGLVAIRDRNLGLLTRSHSVTDNSADKPGNTVISPELRHMVDSGARIATFHTQHGLDDRDRIVTARRLDNDLGYAIVGLDTGDYLADWIKETFKTLLFVACFVAVSFLSYRFILRLLSKYDEANQALDAARKFSETVLLNSPLPMAVFSPNGQCVETNVAYAQIMGSTRSHLKGAHNFKAFHALGLTADFEKALETGEPRHGEVNSQRMSGKDLWFDYRLTPVEIDGLTHILSQVIDVTQQHLNEKELSKWAFYDLLTELPNRRLFQDRLHQAVAQSKRQQSYGAVLFLDLNKFKTLNDTHGHDVGDRLLVEIAKRLRGLLRDTDTVARLGGDEFVILVEGLGPDLEIATNIVASVREKIHQALLEEFSLGTIRHCVSASIGMKLFLGDKMDAEQIIREADDAMYEAKRAQTH